MISSATARARGGIANRSDASPVYSTPEHPCAPRAQVVLEPADGGDVDRRPRTAPGAPARRTPTSSSAARVASAYARDSPPVPSITPPNQRETTATTSVSSRPRSTARIGGAAGARAARRRRWPARSRAPGPTTKALQWWRAFQCCLRTCVDDPAGALLVAHPGERAEEPGLARPRSRPSRRVAIVKYDETATSRRYRSAAVWHDRFMRIVSLLPSTTEILFDIGAGDDVVGVTFECDHPAEARERTDRLDQRACPRASTPPGIDAFVTAAMRAGEDLYHLDEGALAGLDADLVVTQDLCAVCAVDVSVVDDALAHLGCTAEVLTIDPHTLDEVLGLGRARSARPPVTRPRRTTLVHVAASSGSTRWRGGGRPRPGRRRGCCCWSGPTRRSRRATGCRRWSRLAGGVPTDRRGRREVGAGDLGAGAAPATRTSSCAPRAATTSTGRRPSARDLVGVRRAAGPSCRSGRWTPTRRSRARAASGRRRRDLARILAGRSPTRPRARRLR